MGLWNATDERGIFFYVAGFDIHGIVSNGPGNVESYTLANISPNTWYHIHAYSRSGYVYFYIDNRHYNTIETEVPITGLATALYVQLYATANPSSYNYELLIDNYEVNQLW